MSAGAVCIKCGYPKRHFLDGCRNCGYSPDDRESKGKSLILSLDYKIGEDDRSLSWEELRAIGKIISDGHEFNFNRDEVDEAARHVDEFEKTTGLQVFFATLWWLSPLIAVLLFLWLLN